MFGYPAEELLRRDVSVLVDLEPAERDGFLRRLELARRQVGDAAEVHELVACRKDGSRFPVDAALGVMSQPDGAHTVAVVRDATERKRNEREKAEFVSTVSHELRTPLTSIAGSLGLLSGGAAGELPSRAARLIAIAESNSKRLVRLINDLLDMEKIQSGNMTFELAPLDLAELAARAIESVSGFGETLSVRFVFHRPPAPLTVRADADRLTQVIVNLLSNAAKFSPPNRPVEVTVETHGARARVSVRDHGPGVPDHFRDRIFSKFAQADASDTREKGGTGLGLAISREIVERHGGRIWFDSKEGEGSTFHFELALTADEPAAAPAEVAGRLLLVEDDEDLAGVLSEILAADGLVADHVRTLAEAEAALAEPDRYAALLLDLRLPDGNGFDLLRRLREREETTALPVIIVSAAAASGEGGFDVVDWLEKPVDAQRLRQAVSAACAASGGHRPIVLHVDDDSDVRRLVAEALGDHCDVVSADSLRAARRVLDRARPDVVILDIGLADGSGLELLPRLGADPLRKAPVVIFSAQNVDDRDLAAAVDGVLTKSRTSLEDLARLVRRLAARSAEPTA
jgi:PAS domain S-box-containing protein